MITCTHCTNSCVDTLLFPLSSPVNDRLLSRPRPLEVASRQSRTLEMASLVQVTALSTPPRSPLARYVNEAIQLCITYIGFLLSNICFIQSFFCSYYVMSVTHNRCNDVIYCIFGICRASCSYTRPSFNNGTQQTCPGGQLSRKQHFTSLPYPCPHCWLP